MGKQVWNRVFQKLLQGSPCARTDSEEGQNRFRVASRRRSGPELPASGPVLLAAVVKGQQEGFPGQAGTAPSLLSRHERDPADRGELTERGPGWRFSGAR